MKKILLASALSLFAAASAFAGGKGHDYVTISTQYSYATGDLGSARNSPDAMQQIGCSIHAYSTSPVYVSCAAIDAKGNRAWCTSTNADIVKAGQSIGTDSDIVFSWDATGSCVELNITNISSTPPKAP